MPPASDTQVSIAPLSASQGLQVLSADVTSARSRWRWTDIEPAPERGEVILFAGAVVTTPACVR